uniref:unspecific monooxygenase n=1 Tax=Mythimna separata TaxID=271217 RepID=A0A977XSY0_MYTSE|nr:cytochrome P450 P450 6B7-like protein [Mythimna separata]
MLLFYLTIGLTVLVSALYYYFTRTFNYWKSRNVPGPEPTIFFGNMKESALRRKNKGVEMQEIYEMFPNEKVVGIYRMTTPCLLIRDLDILKHIFVKDFEVFTDRGVEFSKQGLGQNLFHADGETWRALRNRFTPIFTSGKLKSMYYLMHTGANQFLDYVATECQSKKEFEVHSLVQTYTLSTISACAFGVNFDCLSDKLEALKLVDKFISEPSFANELDMMYPGLLASLNLSIIPTPIQKFFKFLVDDIIAQRNGKPSGRHDFMDLILELRELGEVNNAKFGNSAATVEITDDVIAAQAFVFYVAGYETSATTMAYLMYQLALNQDVQDKLRAEVDAVIEAHNGEVTYETMKDMKYLNKVFDETLRMYSIVEPLQRRAIKDYKVPGTDLVIEKNTTVLISPRGIQYDEKYYPKPEVFNPDRFDADEVGKRHPCAYLPFGLGPRNCIGMRFARLQSQLCIAMMLSKFIVEPSKNTDRNLKVAPDRFIIGPDGGIPLNVIPRKLKA